MMAATDPYRQWDAAYVLGALSAKERLEFELHLASCQECSAAVAELAGVPGLLAKVPESEVGATGPAAPDLLPKLARAARRHRIRVRILTVGTAAIAAAAAAVLAIALPLGPSDSTGPVAKEATLSQVVQSPLHADVQLVSVAWGTKIDMTCRYTATGTSNYPAPPVDYAMFVTDAGGHSSQVATWAAAPGSTVTLSGATSLRVDAIRSVDVRSVHTGKVLLTTTLPPSVSNN
jgi:anti-sigma factor RsiW